MYLRSVTLPVYPFTYLFSFPDPDKTHLSTQSISCNTVALTNSPGFAAASMPPALINHM